MNYCSRQNRNYKWILTAIDNFSKKVFSIGMKNKTGEATGDALVELCEKENIYPKIIQNDNGGESIDQAVKDWAVEYHIKLVRTLSYTPTSNDLIESFNNILRKMIREGFIRNNNFNWIDHLDIYIYKIEMKVNTAQQLVLKKTKRPQKAPDIIALSIIGKII